MKFTSIILFVLMSVAAIADNEPKVIQVAVEKGFMTRGFDDNDNIQITVAGVFPSSCYKLGPTKGEVDAARGTVLVTQTAYFYGGMCFPMKVPFSETVTLGVVKSGVYTVADKTSNKALGEITVVRSTKPESDDFLYAPVTDAYVTDANKTPKLVLNIAMTDRCTKLKEVRIQYQKDVILVLPIIEHEMNVRCPVERGQFQHVETLHEGLKGTYLLHVRAMNGKAINKVVEIKDIGDPIGANY